MPPAIAAVVWSILLLLLIRQDSKVSKPSLVLWIPVVWMFFLGSKTPAQWLGLLPADATVAFAEGSGFDRGIFLALIGLAGGVLIARPPQWTAFIARNSALTLFLVFALMSVIWSDFPLITFKRWFRDLGTYLIVVLVLSDKRPVDAVCTVIRRSSYLLLILSAVLIKYYPHLGIAYDEFLGLPEYAGATTSKNMLGAVCLISGTFFFWDTLRRWPDRRVPGMSSTLLANVAMLAMTLWLIRLSSSATSQGCLAVAWVVVVLLRSNWSVRHPRAARIAIPLGLCAGAALELSFDLSGTVAEFFGRDPTLHGRTGIWSTLLALQTNPIVGVGYQSFWLGDRLATVWSSLNVGFFNSAHNGYLEIYLSLGAIGLALIVAIMVSSYWRISRQISVAPQFVSLGLAMWSIMIVYNFTESAFGASFLWFGFMMFGLADAQPEHTQAPAETRPRFHLPGTASSHARVRWRAKAAQFTGGRAVTSSSRTSAATKNAASSDASRFALRPQSQKR